jgi:hypothetical protein
LILGLTTFFLKHFHIAPALVVLPTMLIIPLVIFYGVVFGCGYTIEEVSTPLPL